MTQKEVQKQFWWIFKQDALTELIELLIALIVIWSLSSCGGKIRPIPPIEETVIDPKVIGCTCPGFPDLSHFIILGDAKFSRLISKLNQCYAQGLIDDLKEFP